MELIETRLRACASLKETHRNLGHTLASHIPFMFEKENKAPWPERHRTMAARCILGAISDASQATWKLKSVNFSSALAEVGAWLTL